MCVGYDYKYLKAVIPLLLVLTVVLHIKLY
jgi:hypothetical protein